MYLTPKFNGVFQYGPALSGQPSGALCSPVQALTATGQIFEFAPNDGLALEQVNFLCTTSLSATSAPVITFYQRPVASIAGSDTKLGTLTVPTGTVAGQLVYIKLSETSNQILQGQSLVMLVTTLASSAGKGIVSFQAGQLPSQAGNLASGIAVTG